MPWAAQADDEHPREAHGAVALPSWQRWTAARRREEQSASCAGADAPSTGISRTTTLVLLLVDPAPRVLLLLN